MKRPIIQIEKIYSLYQNSTGVSKDTRTLIPGNIYFALKGENHNGNDFAADALEKKAIVAIVDEEQTSVKGNERVIFVDNVLDTLQKLAHYHRKQLDAKVIGLTGSNGKTTTKELLHSILKAHEVETYATEGNLNNHIGVPLTLLSIPSSAKFAIIEMGSNQPGDISDLCEIALPEYGLITNIGRAHLQKLENRNGVFEEKSALFRSIENGNGVFFKNDSDPFLSTLQSERIIPYSKDRTLLSQIKIIQSPHALSFELNRDKEKVCIRTHLFGKYNLENLAAAITIAEYFSAPFEIITRAIEEYQPSNMRSEIRKTDKNVLIVDAYNSNPDSLKQALDEFTKSSAKKKIAFIGDMLELGSSSESAHRKIVDYLDSNSDTRAYFVGAEFGKVANDKHLIFKDVDECISSANISEIENATILLKGSRAIQLEKLIPHL